MSASPIVCVECEGAKGEDVDYCPRECRDFNTPPSCTHARSEWVDCSRCKGKGSEPCTSCEEPATEIGADGQPYCPPCAEAVRIERLVDALDQVDPWVSPGAEDDEDEPREDGPMGGMGYEGGRECSHTYAGGDCDR